ncbi:MAG TPA: hypothetical protein DCQ98_03330, partial [Planctomycetaceae bacterium]|nr:hypothetical protein [Planctomycetaceae bacterium]
MSSAARKPVFRRSKSRRPPRRRRPTARLRPVTAPRLRPKERPRRGLLPTALLPERKGPRPNRRPPRRRRQPLLPRL